MSSSRSKNLVVRVQTKQWQILDFEEEWRDYECHVEVDSLKHLHGANDVIGLSSM